MISSLNHIIKKVSLKYPLRTALIEEDKFISYKDLEKSISLIADYMIANGLKKGQRVGLLSRNSIEYITAFFAINRAGGVIVPLNYMLNSEELIAQANNCSITALYAGKGFGEKAKAIMQKTKSMQKAAPNDLAAIIYTSGTTRRGLGVMLSNKNLISNNLSIAKYLKLTPRDIICCVLPLHYIYGLSLVLSHFLAGGTVIIENRFMYPKLVLETIERRRATGFAGVSSHYAMLLSMSDISKRHLPSLRYFAQAGDRMPEDLTRRLSGMFSDKAIYLMYGQTEASPRLTYLNPDLVNRKPGSVGRAIAGVKIRIINEKGQDCRAEEEGEIIAHGDNIMLGYWNNAKETSKVIRAGWLYTGDIAFKDREGDIFIVGRKKNFIKVGANRVNPLEIERLVMEDKRILEAAVIGVQDKILGEKPRLFISLTPGEILDPKEVIDLCRSRLPSYKVPSEVRILDFIPKNSYGKISKTDLMRIK